MVNLRDCQIGEVQTALNTFTICQNCEVGKFPLSKDECGPCLAGGDCRGGNDVYIYPGYWRKSNESLIILKCENNEINCKGGLIYGNGLCIRGHIGPLCEECDIFA
jgi:hypothetical protein